MIGQAISLDHKKYNTIILAGGKGERMGEQSDYIPKALSKIGNQRAIDYIIQKYELITDKFIIGTGSQADLLESYVKGRYPKSNIEFSYEPVEKLYSNCLSALYCLDHADSRLPTLVTFCDLIIVSNNVIKPDVSYVVDKSTKGKLGTYKGVWGDGFMEYSPSGRSVSEIENGYGVLGNYTFSDTYLLKYLTYWRYVNKCDALAFWDFSIDVMFQYNNHIKMTKEVVDTIYEFGNENDLQEVRKLWENSKA